MKSKEIRNRFMDQTSIDFDVHIWLVPFNLLSNTDLLTKDLLSNEEMQRMGQFATQALRQKYLHSHCVLKLLLGRYLECPPTKISYKNGLYNKPFITRGGKPLYFNLSHSNEWGLYGFSWTGSLGVDIEDNDREIGEMEVADLIFSSQQKQDLNAISCLFQRRSYFLKLWTAKEAFVKMLGIGIGDYLSYIDFNSKGEALLPSANEAYNLLGKIHSIIHPQYTASIATNNLSPSLEFYELTDVRELST